MTERIVEECREILKECRNILSECKTAPKTTESAPLTRRKFLKWPAAAAVVMCMSCDSKATKSYAAEDESFSTPTQPADKPFESQVSERPYPLGNQDSILTAFDGDLSAVQFPIAHMIINPDTLGQPTSGYLYTPEAYPCVTYLFNNSGYNYGYNSDEGRTAAVANRTVVHQYGQGDCVAYNASAFVMGDDRRISGDSWVGNPAGSLFNGDIQAGADGVYLNPYEIVCLDDGKDVACVGHVINLKRDNNTGDNECFWNGIRIQNVGRKDTDVGYMLSGGFDWGMSFTQAQIEKAAIALRAGQKIELNAEPGRFNVQGTPTDYIEYTNSIYGIHIVVKNTSCLQIKDTQITAVVPLVVYGKVGFFGMPPQDKQVVSGSTNSNQALKSLLNALSKYGLIDDRTI